MITNKVLVTVNVPLLEKKFDIFIPVNRKVHSVLGMIKQILCELSNGSFSVDGVYTLYNANNGNAYDMNMMVRDTDIRNDSQVILL